MHQYFYTTLLLAILAQLYLVPGLRLGVVTAVIILMMGFKEIKRNQLLVKTQHNKLILLYAIYNTGTICLYIINEIPVSVFWAEWSNSILPVIFYYFGIKSDRADLRFYKNTLQALLVAFLIGFYLWMSGSEIYRVFMDATEGAGTDLLYFQSLFGLTATGAFGVIGFLIGTEIIFKSRGEKGKLALIICAISAIITFRRAAMLALFSSAIAMHYFGYFKLKYLKKKYLIIEALALIGVFLYTSSQFGEVYSDIIERAGMISDAFESRSGTWTSAFDFTYLVTGRGLGAVGHKAVGFSDYLIPDGNFFKIIAETGLVGFVLFALIITMAIKAGAKRIKDNYLALGVVLCMCLMAIGSNIFTYQSIAPIFWYSIGRLVADPLLNDCQHGARNFESQNLSLSNAAPKKETWA